jgi:hypothetical protein
MVGFGYDIKKRDIEPLSGQKTIVEDRFVVLTMSAGVAAVSLSHGLVTVPSLVVYYPTSIPDGLNAGVTEGTHTSTAVVLTAASSTTWKVLAYK